MSDRQSKKTSLTQFTLLPNLSGRFALDFSLDAETNFGLTDLSAAGRSLFLGRYTGDAILAMMQRVGLDDHLKKKA